MKKSILQEIDEYVDDVLSGRKVAGKSEILAVQRYVNDKKRALDCGFYLDIKAGERPINFIQKLKHTKGKWAGKPLLLESWQKFIVFNLFAWRKADGSRRFRYAYVEVARKNGKTALAAGIALYMLYAEREPRAEVYSVATVKDQAKLCFNDSVAIVKQTALSQRMRVFRDSILYEQLGAYFKPLSSDDGIHDGYSPYCVIVDEYHAHKDNGMLDVMRSGMAARTQPLVFIITTAGFNKNYPCYAYRQNAKNVIGRIVEDDSLFAIIFEMDAEDDWTCPDCWSKANPNLGISVDYEYLAGEVKDAQNRPEAVRGVKTKNLNMWVDAETTWILDDVWQQCGGALTLEDVEGCKCWGGLDLSNISDITAYVLIFEVGDKLALVPKFWIPEDKLQEKIAKENVHFAEWVQKGYVTVTPGNVIDYDFVKADILAMSEKYGVSSIAYDRWNSSQMIIQLQDEGLEMSPFGQGYGSMSAPSKEFEKMVLAGKIEHFNNPVLRWMLASTAIQTDPAGNIKPDKRKSSQKIDGIVASIMALGEMMTAKAKEEKNPYQSRGMRSF